MAKASIDFKPVSTGGGGTASELLTAIKTVDGTGSGLDADLLDGVEASALAGLTAPALVATTPAPVLSANLAPAIGDWTLGGGATTDGSSVTLPAAGTMTCPITLAAGQVVQVDLVLSSSTGSPQMSTSGGSTAIVNAADRTLTIETAVPATSLTIGGAGWSAVVTSVTVRRLDTRLSPAVTTGTAGEHRSWSSTIALGSNAARSVTTAANVTALGIDAAKAATSAANLTALGVNAALSATTAADLTAVGFDAGRSATSALYFTALGSGAGRSATTAAGLTAIGFDAGRNITTGANLTAVGANAGRTATTAVGLTAIGVDAGRSVTNAQYITAVGMSAAYSATSAQYLTAIGLDAAYTATTAQYLTAVGANAARSATTAIGLTALGVSSARAATSAGNLTGIGADAGRTITTGANNTALGAASGYTDGTTATGATVANTTMLGYQAQATVSNVCTIGSAITANRVTLCLGNYNALGSDVRGGFALADASVVPTTNPTGGGILFSEGGALKWRNPSGTVTTVAP